MKAAIKKGILQYLLADYMAASVAWFLFLIFRKSDNTHLDLPKIIQSISVKDEVNIFIIIPLFWFIIHLFSGAYFNPYRKSRLNEIARTFASTFLGTLLIFWFIIINDEPLHIGYYTQSFFALIFIQFLLNVFTRNIVLTIIKSNIKTGKFGFNTLLIGGNQVAVKVYNDIVHNATALGNNFKGFVYANDSGENGMSKYLPKLGSITDIETIIDQHQIDEVIIAIDSNQHHQLQDILIRLSQRPTVVKILPDMFDIIAGSVKTSNVLGAVFIEIYPELMPDWQRVIKRALDIFISFLVIIVLSPLYLFAALKVKLSSKGAIFYQQQRIGIYGIPFAINKFRSMYTNAEANGPALSSEEDPRITPWGKVMRKWRIDELPQFYNILKGDMSLVGPRPERKHFIDIICKTHPHYKYLHKVKPGLTSWGMVKYGYAENVEEMKERMKYDLLYIKNCSLALDTKIIFYTTVVILQGRGK